MRSVLHIDMNDCYASIECLYDPSIRNLPVAVGGDVEARHGIILAKNQIAKRFGIEDKYTEGRTQEEWVRWCYEETRKKHPDAMPDFDTFWKQGIVKVPGLGKGKTVVMKAFRDDPVKNPLKTPSGKIEIYSERLAKLAKDWTLPKGDVISALPKFCRTWEMPGDPLQKKYPRAVILRWQPSEVRTLQSISDCRS